MKAITGATLIDGTGNPPVQNATVLIEEDRIKASDPSGTVQVPAEAQVIDGSGMVLLPGLINTHEHLHAFGHDLATRWGLTEPISTRHMRIAAGLKRTLESGFTTVRDAGWLDAGSDRPWTRGWSRDPGYRSPSPSSRPRAAWATAGAHRDTEAPLWTTRACP